MNLKQRNQNRANAMQLAFASMVWDSKNRKLIKPAELAQRKAKAKGK